MTDDEDDDLKVGDEVEFANPFDDPPDTAVEPHEYLSALEQVAAVAEATPKDKAITARRCRECGGEIVIDGNWRPPLTATAAWEWAVSCNMKCTGTRSDADEPWTWCSRKGICTVRGVRLDYERRKMAPIPWDGVDRRTTVRISGRIPAPAVGPKRPT